MRSCISIRGSVRPSVRQSHTMWISEKGAEFEQNITRNIKLHLKDDSETSASADRQNASDVCYVWILWNRHRPNQLTGDGLLALEALFGEEFPEAVGAIRLFLLGRESLTGQRLFAVAALEAVAVVRLVLVRHAASRNYLDRNTQKEVGMITSKKHGSGKARTTTTTETTTNQMFQRKHL